MHIMHVAVEASSAKTKQIREQDEQTVSYFFTLLYTVHADIDRPGGCVSRGFATC